MENTETGTEKKKEEKGESTEKKLTSSTWYVFPFVYFWLSPYIHTFICINKTTHSTIHSTMRISQGASTIFHHRPRSFPLKLTSTSSHQPWTFTLPPLPPPLHTPSISSVLHLSQPQARTKQSSSTVHSELPYEAIIIIIHHESLLPRIRSSESPKLSSPIRV